MIELGENCAAVKLSSYFKTFFSHATELFLLINGMLERLPKIYSCLKYRYKLRDNVHCTLTFDFDGAK